MDRNIQNFAIEVGIVVAAVVFLWFFFKAMKLMWKVILVILIFLGLSFVLPMIREWLFSFF